MRNKQIKKNIPGLKQSLNSNIEALDDKGMINENINDYNGNIYSS